MLYRWSWFLRALRICPRDPRLLMLTGYELAMFIFSQFFFMYKRNQGFLLWAFWIWGALWCLDFSLRRETPEEEGSAGGPETAHPQG